ncbi:hypothetical protein U9M48_022062 [Paspalum notatum var. saurae]|uniref:Uncharacterized protein n=1 Tax=Paspalum notatum var. saurae TaxID=547442 RepID=A0AAQ3TJ26_PASNO
MVRECTTLGWQPTPISAVQSDRPGGLVTCTIPDGLPCFKCLLGKSRCLLWARWGNNLNMT